MRMSSVPVCQKMETPHDLGLEVCRGENCQMRSIRANDLVWRDDAGNSVPDSIRHCIYQDTRRDRLYIRQDQCDAHDDDEHDVHRGRYSIACCVVYVDAEGYEGTYHRAGCQKEELPSNVDALVLFLCIGKLAGNVSSIDFGLTASLGGQSHT